MREAWYYTLSFAAKATLLIALSLRPPFVLLVRHRTVAENWLSPAGQSARYEYWLEPPFGRPRRVPRLPGRLRAVGE